MAMSRICQITADEQPGCPSPSELTTSMLPQGFSAPALHIATWYIVLGEDLPTRLA
jgi:hypothetical protein